MNWYDTRRKYADSDTADREARQQAVRQLKRQHHIVKVRESGELYRYDPATGTYRDDGEQIVRDELEEGRGEFNRRSEANAIIYKLRLKDAIALEDFDPEGEVCVVNGVLNISNPANPKLRDHSPEKYFRRHRPVRYAPDAECPRFEEFVTEVVRAEDLPKLQEYVGYTVFHHWDVRFQRALFIIGSEATGKSTFLNVIAALLGEENIANQSVQRLANNNFATSKLVGKLANIRNDLDSSIIQYTGPFKEIVGGDPMPAEEKFKPQYSFRPTQKLLFSANRVPKVEKATDAFYRRWLHVEFPETIPTDEQDEELEEELKEELSGILNWALDGYRRLMENGGFTNERTIEEKRAVWESYGDFIERFVESGQVDLDPDVETPKDEVYSAYQQWATERDLPVKTKGTLTKKLKRQYGVGTCRPGTGSDRVRCYRGIDIHDEQDSDVTDPLEEWREEQEVSAE